MTPFQFEKVDDLEYWVKTDRKIFQKLMKLIREIQRTPFEGTGKPESLRGNLSGYWSRRITQEHRLVYKVTEEAVIIVSCRGHYEDK